MRRRRGLGDFVNQWFANAPLLWAIVFAFALPADAGASEPLKIANLEVGGGEGNWHADNVFRVEWDQVPGPPSEPAAVIRRIYDSHGQVVKGPIRETTRLNVLDSVQVPPVPDVYTLEIWLEDSEGQAGPPAFAQLRFDDTRPQPPVPLGPAGWISTAEEAQIENGHPAEPLPLSGIRGYAFSLDSGTGGSPCAQPTSCSVAETDLGAGIDDDSFSVGPLPEGTAFVRVVAVSGAGVASPVASVPLQVDGTVPELSLQGLPVGWSSGPVRLTALAGDRLSGMAAAGLGGPFTAIAVDDGAPAVSLGDSVSTWVAGDGTHRVTYYARDAAGNVDDGVLGPAPAEATVRIDEEPPQVSFARTQDPAEPERIEATVTDSLSGPSPDRGAIALRRVGSHARFEVLPTEVLGDRLVAHWDSDSYPTGKYEFQADGYDRAGNAAVGSERAEGAKMVLVNPLKAPVTLEAGFGGRQMVWQRCTRSRHGRHCRRQRIVSFDGRPASRTVPFGHGVRFGGRLRSARGVPLGDQQVAVRETFAAGAEPEARTTLVRTQPDGTFSLQLAPGPSREVSASFGGTRTLSRRASRSVHLGVLAGVRLRVSAATAKVGGAPVIFSGSVDRTGATRSNKGLPIELQFRYPGAEWSEFRTVEADAHGRFRYAYRFSDDDSRGVRFQFRAYVNGREGWPYEPAFSRPLAVLGR